MPFASTTMPCAAAPCSITVTPSTVTGSATVAVNPCPAWLWFELSPSFRRTVIDFPSGITTGFGAVLACSPDVLPDDALPDGVALPAAELSAGFDWSQPSANIAIAKVMTESQRASFICSPPFLNAHLYQSSWLSAIGESMICDGRSYRDGVEARTTTRAACPQRERASALFSALPDICACSAGDVPGWGCSSSIPHRVHAEIGRACSPS